MRRRELLVIGEPVELLRVAFLILFVHENGFSDAINSSIVIDGLNLGLVALVVSSTGTAWS